MTLGGFEFVFAYCGGLVLVGVFAFYVVGVLGCGGEVG